MAPLAEAAALAGHIPFGVRRQIVGKWQGDDRRFPDDANWGSRETVLTQTLGEQMRIRQLDAEL